MISAIEDIIFKLSGIALTMLQNADSDPLQVRNFIINVLRALHFCDQQSPYVINLYLFVCFHRRVIDQVLSVLRLNLRILVRLFDTSTSLTEGINKGLFDLQQVALVMNQCTQALYQLCAMHYVPDIHGVSTLQLVSLLSSSSTEIAPQHAYEGDIYQDLDDCDIEMEDGDGTYVPYRPTTASSTSNSTKANAIVSSEVAQTNGDIAGVSYLNQLMTKLFPTVRDLFSFVIKHKNNHRVDSSDQMSVLTALLESATHINGIYKLLSVSEIDCKWLNSSGTLVPIIYGLTLFKSNTLYTYITSTANDLAVVVVNCVTTMLAVVRNFSEVKSCRQVLLEKEITPVLCLLLKVFTNDTKVSICIFL